MLCNPCDAIVTAENLWAQLGLDKPKKLNIGFMPRSYEAFTAQFLHMLGLGKTLDEIAGHWSVDRRQLLSKVARARGLGHQIPHLRTPGAQIKERPLREPPQRRYVGWKHNEHGGGKYGVSRCNAGPDGKRCQPCRERMRIGRKEERARRRRRLNVGKVSAVTRSETAAPEVE